jgi:hypothetical protein
MAVVSKRNLKMTDQVTEAARAALDGVDAPATETTTEKVVTKTNEDDATDTSTDAAKEGSDDAADGETKERDPWPRTAQDAVRRRNKRIAKRDAEIAELRKQTETYKAEIAKYKPKEATVDPADPEPALAQYDDWGKYNRDLTQWNVRQMQKAEQAKNVPPAPKAGEMNFSPEEKAWLQQRVPQVAQRKEQVLKDYPEYAEFLNQHTEEAINDLPEAIQLELIKAKDPVLSVVGLVQEGILDDLAEMSPALAAKYINAAAARLQGANASSVGQAAQTQAPAPISRPRVQSKSQKSPMEMSDEEFRKKYL